MISWFKKLFEEDSPPNYNRHSSKEIKKFKEIWKNLDPKLQECAKDPFEFGNKTHIGNIRLNQVGMIQLIQHLDKHGFEIRKKL